MNFDDTVTESPIEHRFLCALVDVVDPFDITYPFDKIHIITEKPYLHFITDDDLILEPQAQIGRFRVDFFISVPANMSRRLVVECDGHDFHERTKEQAARDRSRDRALQMAGYEIFRFTGSELHRDPKACAMEVMEWASKQWELKTVDERDSRKRFRIAKKILDDWAEGKGETAEEMMDRIFRKK
ncbi:MAG: hypothetical protein JWP25_9027 [Bradyrhizobium sp.]|nr:hypothetical protein [Bradyrhizobium sp.]